MSFYRPRMDREESQYRHARRNARGRWGIDLTRELYDAWVAAIQNRNKGVGVRSLGRETRTRTHFAVEHDGREIPVVYDRERGTIATVLPESGLLGPKEEG
ncbi:MAG TPA: hypothetical protein VMZ50_04915 [Phycisphaerae bacterium]|nr:hypothetical protein [Phycisphaerae bacterium]